jgi:hypothetical protein
VADSRNSRIFWLVAELDHLLRDLDLVSGVEGVCVERGELQTGAVVRNVILILRSQLARALLLVIHLN